jgi:hypothetical protein
MRLWIVVLISVLLYCSTSAYADGVFLEGGQGLFRSTDSQTMFFSYQMDSSQIFGLNSFYKVALGSWDGQCRNDTIILAKGIWWNLPEKTYFCFEPGGAYIKYTTQNLGTHLQFAFRFALGMRIEKIDLSFGYRHFSDGKAIFHWTDTPNYGDNFITLQIGYLL